MAKTPEARTPPAYVQAAERAAQQSEARYTAAQAQLDRLRASGSASRADRQALEETVARYREAAEEDRTHLRAVYRQWQEQERRDAEAALRASREDARAAARDAGREVARARGRGGGGSAAVTRRDTRPSRRSYVFVEPGTGTAGRIIDLAPAAGAAMVVTFFVGAQKFPTDMVWDLVATFLGGLMAMEGTGELRNIGYGMFGASVTYGALRLTGSLGSHVV